MNSGSKTAAIVTAGSVLAVAAAVYSTGSRFSHWIFSAKHIAKQRAARYRKRKDQIPSLSSDRNVTTDLKEIVRSIFVKPGRSVNPSTTKPGVQIEQIEQNQDGEYMLCLIFNGRAIYVDLVQFCREVTDSQQIYTSTLVFLYDVTGGKADIVTKLLQTDDNVACCSGHPVQWMKQFCGGLHLSNEKKDMVLRALCRVEASCFATAKCILFPISTDYVSTLLPAIHSVFPDDKHIFLYTGCTQAVAQPKAIPLHPLSSIHIRAKEYHKSMSKLPFRVAAAVEAWMSAVDMLILMQDDFLTNSFLPYVCRLDYLLLDDDPIERRWAVRSLVQYCTGSDKHLERAIKAIEPPKPDVSSHAEHIDAVVFCHKRILIAHKTLPDTVPAVEHWALKQQAGPGGCACCMEEDEDEESERLKIEQKMESIMARSSASTPSTNYVDGKLGFAFDPSRFG